jgi:HNH endonuclease
MGAELTNDHFQPTSKGGSDVFANFVYSCHACNEFKSDYWQPDSEDRVLHPLNDDLTQHWEENEAGVLVPKTQTGLFHIEQLHLNRFPLVARRLHRQQMTDFLKDKTIINARVAQLENNMNTIRLRPPLGTGNEEKQ